MDLYLENQTKQTNSVRSKQSLSTVQQMVFIITTECLSELRKPWGKFTEHTVEINESLSKGSSCRLSQYCKIRETHLLGPDLTILPAIPPPPFPTMSEGTCTQTHLGSLGSPKEADSSIVQLKTTTLINTKSKQEVCCNEIVLKRE
jgi:hypothetical protein